jgi:hypothetical protein
MLAHPGRPGTLLWEQLPQPQQPQQEQEQASAAASAGQVRTTRRLHCADQYVLAWAWSRYTCSVKHCDHKHRASTFILAAN